MRTEKQSDKIFYATPGAYFGAMPETMHYEKGHVTVQTVKLLDAVSYLRKYYKIIGTRSSRYEDATMIDIAIKTKKA